MDPQWFSIFAQGGAFAVLAYFLLITLPRGAKQGADLLKWLVEIWVKERRADRSENRQNHVSKKDTSGG